jgi:hypothetical protein
MYLFKLIHLIYIKIFFLKENEVVITKEPAPYGNPFKLFKKISTQNEIIYNINED